MDRDEIKQAYRETLRGDTPEASKGAALGLLMMARDASAPIDFEFSQPDGEYATFYMRVVV